MEELRRLSTSQSVQTGLRSHETISNRRDLTYFLELLSSLRSSASPELVFSKLTRVACVLLRVRPAKPFRRSRRA